MAKSIIGHDNYLEDATVYASSSPVAGYPVANCLDGRTNTQTAFASGSDKFITFDLGSTKTINYIGLAKQTLGTAVAVLKISSGPTGTGPWTEEDRFENINNLGTLMFKVSEFSTRFLLVEFSNYSSTMYLGALAVGKYIEPPVGMPVGFTQPRWGDQDEIRVNKTRGNEFVGMSTIDKPKAATIILKDIETTWYDTYWSDFIENIKRRPFFFSWNPDDRQGENIYCWPVKKIAAPKYTKKTRCSVSLKVEGIV